MNEVDLTVVCNEPELAYILSIMKSLFDILQIIVPIVLMIGVGIELIKMFSNPDNKTGFKPLISKIIAAILFFFLPIIVTAIMAILPSSLDVVKCWNIADDVGSNVADIPDQSGG